MFRILSAASVAALLAAPTLACEGFEVHHPYARASTPMAPSGAAFMVLVNNGPADCQIVGVRSDVAARTELHTHLADANGVMRMVEIEGGIDLPAGTEHALDRGGDHVMFLGLNTRMTQDAVLAVTFLFADGSEATVDVPVDLDRQPGGGHGQMQGQTHGHGHGGHGN